MESLFERLGGRQPLHSLIDLFYYKMLLDPKLKRKFGGANIITLKEHQLEFMTYVFGGPGHAYPTGHLRTAHANLHITNADFNHTCDHLRKAMEELAIDAPLIDEAMHIIDGTREDIVTE